MTGRTQREGLRVMRKDMELTDRDIDRIAERLFQKMRRLEERKLDIE
jgi:hypothetical protein